MLERATLQGLWTRSLIAWPDGRRDETTSVNWLQGPTFYIDLRQPAQPPDFRAVGSLRDLDRTQVSWLAEQEGFAGTFVQHDTFFEWERRIDFQPKPIYSDRGTLTETGDMMIEVGCDIPYVEHWHRAPSTQSPSAALELHDPLEDCRGMIVISGRRFMVARSRRRALDESRHLRDYVADAASLAEAQDLIDCELSLGTVTTQGWLIERSTLPYRVGTHLDLRVAVGGTIHSSDRKSDGCSFDRIWTITQEEGPFFDLLSTLTPSPTQFITSGA